MSKEVTKYVIEIPDDISFNPQFLTLYGVEPKGDYVRTYDIEMDETEELTSDYVNEHFGELQDEAFHKGLVEGNDIGYKNGVKDGQNESWECARKIVCDDSCGGMSMKELLKIFGRSSDAYIIRDFTAQQAIAKLKAYEEKQSDKIKRGDIVNVKGCCKDNLLGVVTKVREDNCYIMWGDGSGGAWNKDSVVKTGKHIDIDKILEGLRYDS